MNHEVSFFLSALLCSTTSVAVLVAARKEKRKDVASLTLIIFGQQSLVEKKKEKRRANDETEKALVQRRNDMSVCLVCTECEFVDENRGEVRRSTGTRDRMYSRRHVRKITILVPLFSLSQLESERRKNNRVKFYFLETKTRSRK